MLFAPTPAVTLLGFAVLLLVTLHVIVRELDRRPIGSSAAAYAGAAAVLRWAAVLLVIFAVGGTFFSIYAKVAVAVAVVVTVRAALMRRSEELDSLASLIRMVAAGRGSLPDALERFAEDRSTGVARRTRLLAFHLRCGRSPEEAVTAAGLPLGIDAVTAMSGATSPPERPSPTTSERSRNDAAVWMSTWNAWPASAQAAYLLVLVASAFFYLTFLALFIVPTLEKMLEEFGMPVPAYTLLGGPMRYIPTVAGLVFWVSVLWFVAAVIATVSGSSRALALVPWWGGRIVTRNRSRGLDGLAGAVEAGRPAAETFAAAVRYVRSAWLRRRCRRVFHDLGAGRGLADSLRRAGLVTSAEAPWIEAATVTGNLPAALRGCAENAQRRFDLKWQVRTAWMMPLMLLILGGLVAWTAYTMFAVLTALIYGTANL